jgi:ribosomal protein S18 acetylase RimI-like enzyme
MYRAFWPDVRGSYFLRSRRDLADFLRHHGGRIYYLAGTDLPRPPFVLAGKWRDREDIIALWHVKAEGQIRKNLVIEATRECFREGAERVVTKLVSEFEAAEFRQWGFDVAYRIALLERRIPPAPPPLKRRDDVRITAFVRKWLPEVLRVDAAAFNEFWRLDARTIDAIASSCMRNVFLLARRGDRLLGYAIGGANGRLGYLQRLGVHAEHQGKGIGEDLGLAMLHALQRLGAATVMVNTQEDNLQALRLYRNLGFCSMPGSRYILQCAAGSEEGIRR